jgi:hypothetical protein
MRIIHFHGENFKRLRVVDFTPAANGVYLTGANEQGKTSALDAIWAALKGGQALRETPEPIRKGEDKALSEVTLGEPTHNKNGEETGFKDVLVATRSWTKSGTSLKVQNAEGAQFPSPQAVLDKLIGSLTFDPLAFGNMEDKRQLKTLLDLVNIKLDLDKWEEERQRVYNERTVINRQIAQLEAQVKAYTPPVEVAALPAFTIEEVIAEQEEAQKVIKANEVQRRRLEEAWKSLDDAKRRVREGQGGVETAKQALQDAEAVLKQRIGELDSINAHCAEVLSAVDKLEDPDMAVFKDKFSQLAVAGKPAEDQQAHRYNQQNLDKRRQESEALTGRLEQLNHDREAALAKAKMPIEGLSFDSEGVTYRGIPFKQCSSEERLRVSIAIGMAINPKLRVMFVRDASLLDSKNRALLQDMAETNNYQFWIEVADDSGEVGLYFEDGEIKGGAAPVSEKQDKKAKKPKTKPAQAEIKEEDLPW